MDPTITAIITGAVLTALGWIGRTFWTSWREARQGRKDEAQRIAERADRLRTERDHERHQGLRWMDLAYATRAVAHSHGVPLEKLPELPTLEN